MGRVFTNGPGDWGLILSQCIYIYIYKLHFL